ncbi:hypothetical protein T440DRAFT_447625 [Plenodomus tracheiphilus IPT5]|uniref:Uncharacterized protein n=1 Tax=Plenodomus tracheiphilus IPT5 TaxID=1408161 RepID=A0A6A7B9H8_9PLEO|nr:hypothetical protein T440DRAFT_447625 [Plenodomus tracheiphilus IPT5]
MGNTPGLDNIDTCPKKDEIGPDDDDSDIDVRPRGKCTGDYAGLRWAGTSKTVADHPNIPSALPKSAGPNGTLHAEVIRRELEQVLSDDQMNKYIIIQKKDEDAERLFTIAHEVALNERTALHYSNFHTYNAFRDVNIPEEARRAVRNPNGSWRQMTPYANCLAMASANCNALRKRLQGLARFRRYAYRVELVTNLWEQNAAHDLQYHALCILRLDRFCIVIDPIPYRGAQRVPLGQIGGHSIETRADADSWAYVRGPRNARLLVEYAPFNGIQVDVLPRPITRAPGRGMDVEYSDPFSVIRGGLTGGVLNMAYPSSRNLYTSAVGRGEYPSRRTIYFLSTWDRQPTFTDSYSVITTRTTPQFLVTTAKLLISFDSQRSLHLKFIPCVDWLARPGNRHLLRELIAYMSMDRSVDWASKPYMSCEVRFRSWRRLITDGFSIRERRGIRLLEAISEGLGQPKGEINKIAHVMLSVWRTQAQAVAGAAG